jgi:hypothetical protein
MKKLQFVRHIGASVLVGSLALSLPVSVAAQEAQQEQRAQEGSMGMQGMREMHQDMMAEMRQRHERMEAMHQEMTQELQRQLTALREHAKTMEGITDEKQLLTEMKKHQQMTDALLGTMVEQREKMHARMRARHRQMRSQTEQAPQQQESEEHEVHHDE